jgi:DNA (cytosine-5)-methyltransferase 3A
VNVLSVFDGMACGMLAMQRAGIEVERYVAYEIDKYAVQTSSHNFPMIEHRGDVFKADFAEFEGFDFLIGGSPCTYWSIAQKNNRETEASGMGWELFQQYVRALHEAKPRFFVYENNKSMSKAIRASIDEAFGFEAICINSALVSAQNRQRLYWVGKRNEDGTYSKVPIDQPEDRGILLKDVLESGVVDKEGGYELDAESVEKCFTSKGNRIGRIVAGDKNKNHDSQQYRVYSVDGKSVTLCSSPGSLGKMTGLYAVPVEFEGGIPTKAVSLSDGKTYAVYEVKDGYITIKGKRYAIKLADGFYIIRKLTVRECMRLQTMPEWFEFPVSDTQAFRQLGNGWTVSIISHLLNGCIKTIERN